jgi:hypothetical protein
VQVFHGVVHEGALLPTLLCSLQRYYPNITIIWDGRICMFAVLLRFTLSFIYKVYISFLSCKRDWTLVKVQYIWKYGCITTSTWVFSRELANQLNRSRNRYALTVEVPLIAIRKAESVWSNIFFRVVLDSLGQGCTADPPLTKHHRFCNPVSSYTILNQ